MTSPVDSQHAAGGEGDSPMAQIAALMQERARFEGWLGTLETRRMATPTHVFDRVRSDYATRLQQVLDQIASRATDLRQTRESLVSRLTQLQSDESARRDERAEAELRAAVGEYTDGQWKDVSERSDAEISRLVSQRNEVTAELARVDEILAIADAHRPGAVPAASAPSGPAQRPSIAIAQATVQEAAPRAERAPPAAASPPSMPAPAPAPMSAQQSPGLADMPDAAAGEPRPAPTAPAAAPTPAGVADAGAAASTDEFDELAFLNAVVDPTRSAPPRSTGSMRTIDGGVGAGAPPTQPPQPAGAGAAGAGGRDPFDLGVGESDVRLSASSLRGYGEDETAALADPSRSGAGAGTAGRPPRNTSPALHRMATPDASSIVDSGSSRPKEDQPRRPSFTDSMPSILRGMQPVQEKTLKCQECGTMNYPTEWYCEKCGGELAAM